MRAGVVLGILASIATVIGLWLWFFEQDARKIDGAARSAQAVEGAIRELEESRGRSYEAGQTSAFETLLRLKRPTFAIDLNDIVIAPTSVPATFNQQSGSLVVLRGDFKFGKVQNEPRVPSACEASVNLNVDWLILDKAHLRKATICAAGSVILSATLVSPETELMVMARPLPLSHLKSKTANSGIQAFIDERRDPYKQPISPTFFVAANSVLDGAQVATSARTVWVSASSFRHGIFSSQAGVTYIEDSSLRGSALAMLRLGYLAQTPEARKACEATGVTDTTTPEEFQAASLCFSYDGLRLADAIQALTFEQPPQVFGIFITNSDIRGADLSQIPAEFLYLENVCADATTRLPRGVRLQVCGEKLAKFWDDAARTCGKWTRAQRGDGRGCYWPTSGQSEISHPDIRVGFPDKIVPENISRKFEFDIPGPWNRDIFDIRTAAEFPRGGMAFRGANIGKVMPYRPEGLPEP